MSLVGLYVTLDIHTKKQFSPQNSPKTNVIYKKTKIRSLINTSLSQLCSPRG